MVTCLASPSTSTTSTFSALRLSWILFFMVSITVEDIGPAPEESAGEAWVTRKKGFFGEWVTLRRVVLSGGVWVEDGRRSARREQGMECAEREMNMAVSIVMRMQLGVALGASCLLEIVPDGELPGAIRGWSFEGLSQSEDGRRE